MLRILAPLAVTSCSSLARLPARSASLVEMRTMRPVFCRPLVIMRESVVMSTFPPETSATVFSEVSTLSNSQAATLVAPAPSATVFGPSSKATIAAAISSSLTVTISSRYSRQIENVRSPGVSTWIPSAIVAPSFTVVTMPFLQETNMDGTDDAWTPIIFTFGRICLMAEATPEARPPPPTGMMTCSTSGTCSRISRPMVPCPAITSGSLKGCAKV